MSSLKNKFSILTLVLLSTQFVPQVLRPRASSELLDVEGPEPSWQVAQPCALQDVPSALKGAGAPSQEVATKEGWQAPYRLMSAALWPLDFLKKASLCVMKSPYLFLMATSALLPNAVGYGFRSILYEKLEKQRNPRASLGLTAEWDTTSCQGRALSASETRTFQEQKPICRTMACVQKICSKMGNSYTGHFLCKTDKRNTHKAKKRKQINRAILKAEECCDRFCQEDAHDACPQEASTLQSLFGIAPCNEDLCVGRFVPDEGKEIYPGFFESLEDVGEATIRQCKKINPYKRHCRHY